MLGRLFKVFILFFVLFMVARWLFSPKQQQSFHELATVLAQALLISSVLIFVLYFMEYFHH